MSDGPQWFGEPPISGYRQLYEVETQLHREQSRYQTIEVYDTLPLGVILVLDKAIQVAERDEFVYHEMLAHVPLVTHPDPRRLLIVGGGDGGTLRRGLEHGIREGVLVEIDGRVVEVCQTFLPFVAQGVFDHPKSKLIIGDGVDYVSARPKSCDVLLVDSTDPVGPAEALFSDDFLTAAYECLTDDGIFVTQSGSPLLMTSELVRVFGRMKQIFPIVRTYIASIPSYPGVLWSFTLGSKKYDPVALHAGEVANRLARRGITPRYYSAELHQACFALPAFLKDMIEGGKELTIFAKPPSVSCQ